MWEINLDRMDRLARSAPPPQPLTEAERRANYQDDTILASIGATLLGVGLAFGKHPIWGLACGAFAVYCTYEAWNARDKGEPLRGDPGAMKPV